MDLEFKGNTVSTIGKPLSVGEKFPDFTVLDKDNNEVKLSDLLDKTLLISVVPNINTSVCSIQTKHFNEEVDAHSSINFVTISTNTVEEQSNWCAAENVKNMRMLSDVDHDFGKKSNLWIKDLNILARSVWVVDKNDEISYSEIMPVQTDEPSYDRVLGQLNEN
ncbi:thiol peroxidase [Companilactobacillus halodurans]|uniref:Thiol peroxidase n=1 Tax=Companilactobacillus halodurans TaxID=2584183 RepID=A0A5P0ZU05_9LACO|nr:thiol peroxidase [Companilactobacillus halodurans]MQS76303.1 thiol peroxidase [Companilactobacillus halodurans]MQS96566.1 thiol peroxidase [Companilactobacillus halodurans]